MSNSLHKLRHQSFQSQAGRCWYCGVRMWVRSPDELGLSPTKGPSASKLKCTAEHLIARQQGGRDSLENVVAACAHCNQTRHKRKCPPDPVSYQNQVRHRIEHHKWHDRWVFDRGLLPDYGHAPRDKLRTSAGGDTAKPYLV